MCCCTNVKQYKTRTCNSTKSRCHKNFTWKHGKLPKLSLSMTFVACVTCHVVSYLLGAYRKHKWTDIIQNLMTFVDWEKNMMNLCLHWQKLAHNKGWPWAGEACSYFFLSFKAPILCFQAVYQTEVRIIRSFSLVKSCEACCYASAGENPSGKFLGTWEQNYEKREGSNGLQKGMYQIIWQTG